MMDEFFGTEPDDGAVVPKRKPKSGQTLSWRRTVDATGTGQWEAEVIPPHRAVRFSTVGSA